MSDNTESGRVSIPLQRELGVGLELKEPVLITAARLRSKINYILKTEAI